MSDDFDIEIPEGFERLPEGLGFTDNLQPCYIHRSDEGVVVGMPVQKRHGNTMGICHGGVLMTLSDIAAATNLNHARGVVTGSPTVRKALLTTCTFAIHV